MSSLIHGGILKPVCVFSITIIIIFYINISIIIVSITLD
jgi:hypothetical protein